MLTLRLEDTPAADVAVAGEAWLPTPHRLLLEPCQTPPEVVPCRPELAATLRAPHLVDRAQPCTLCCGAALARLPGRRRRRRGGGRGGGGCAGLHGVSAGCERGAAALYCGMRYTPVWLWGRGSLLPRGACTAALTRRTVRRADVSAPASRTPPTAWRWRGGPRRPGRGRASLCGGASAACPSRPVGGGKARQLRLLHPARIGLSGMATRLFFNPCCSLA